MDVHEKIVLRGKANGLPEGADGKLKVFTFRIMWKPQKNRVNVGLRLSLFFNSPLNMTKHV